MLVALAACGPACGPEECAAEQAACVAAAAECAALAAKEVPDPRPAAPPSSDLTPFEHGLVDPVLAEIRSGVRPWDGQSVGVCRGKRECDAFLGADPGELPPGSYLVKAELRVPPAGEKGTWTARFESECTTERPGKEPEVRTYDRTYDVQYVGPERGARLSPLRTIESPSPGGPTRCTWKLVGKGGDTENVMSGSWSTPGRSN